MLHDVRSAVRLFCRDWRFSLTLVITLATGIAATATVFNVINNTLLRPLPIPDEHRVYRLLDWTRGPDGQPLRRSTRAHNFVAIRDQARSFEAIAGLRAVNLALDGGAAPVQTYVALVSPGALALLGVAPAAGRLFSAEEEAAGSDAGVVVLSHALWQQQFAGRADIVGATVRLEGRPHTVVGILAPGFRFPYQVDAWRPERVDPEMEASLATIARLRDDVTPAQALAELEAIAAGVERERPDTNRGLRYTLLPLREQLIDTQARVSWSLFAIAALLLALSCANVANLLLARGTQRTRDMAISGALGASRGRQLRQRIIESLTYASAGSLLGVAAAAALSGTVMNLVPLPLRTQLGLGDVVIDWRVSAFAAAMAMLTALGAGLAPARRLARTNMVDALRQGGRGVTGPRGLMHGLVIGEVAIASVLLLAAGLMAGNLQHLLHADLGLRAEALSSIEITLPAARAESAGARLALARQILARARAMAGVEGAAFVTVNPLDRGSVGAAIETEDRPLAVGEAPAIVNNRLASDGWFETAGVRIVSGRPFTARDDERGAPVAIVSRRMADRFWPGSDPIGKRVRTTRAGAPWLTVVGVAADVRDFGDWRETWYLPHPQHAATFGATTLHLMIRSPLPPDVLGRALASELHALDAGLPVPLPERMTDLWEAGLELQRLAATATALFGGSGLLLASLGTYAVLAYAVSARRRELGIRLALGAGRRAVLVDVIRCGAALAACGLAAGIAAGLVANRALGAVAAESPGTSPALVGVVVIAIGGTALLASSLPAWRATRVDPSDVMRTE